jgi:hypothetical protein
LGLGLITEKNELLWLKIRHYVEGPKLARRHPNGESEGILDGPTPMVRPDLRRDMAGVLEISVPQERVDVGHPGGTSSSRGSGVLGNPVPRDGSEPRPSARISRK